MNEFRIIDPFRIARALAEEIPANHCVEMSHSFSNWRATDLLKIECRGVRWTPASDADSGVALYAILRDGSEIATVSAGTLAHTVTGLSSGATYTFKVEAEDGAASPNRSTDGPSASIALPDWVPPSWAPGDALSANNVGPTSLDLVWPAATDDTAVTEYRVYRGGGLHATLAGSATGLAVTGLDWDSDYSFEIEAGDAAGNVSTRLALDVSTAGPPASAQPSDPTASVPTTSV